MSVTRKRSLKDTEERSVKKECTQQGMSGVKLVLDAIPANKQTLRRGTKEWPTRKEPPREVDVLWYKDEGGNANCLNFCVHLVHKDTGLPALGREGTRLKHELLIRETPVLHSAHTSLGLEMTQGCRPVIGLDGTCTLRLRITDVSKNHGNTPFRVRISLFDEYFVESVCSELIVVRSKRGGANKNPSPKTRPKVVNPSKVFEPMAINAGGEIGNLVERLQGCQNITSSQRADLEETTAGVLKSTSVAFEELTKLHCHLGFVLEAYKTNMNTQLERLAQTVAAVERCDGEGSDSKAPVSSRKLNVSNLERVGGKTPLPHHGLPIPVMGRTFSVGSNFSIDLEMFNGFSPRSTPRVGIDP